VLVCETKTTINILEALVLQSVQHDIVFSKYIYIYIYQQISKDFGLTVTMPNTKYMVTVELCDQEPISLMGTLKQLISWILVFILYIKVVMYRCIASDVMQTDLVRCQVCCVNFVRRLGIIICDCSIRVLQSCYCLGRVLFGACVVWEGEGLYTLHL